MSGGLGGMEMDRDEEVHVTVQVEGDVNILVDDKETKGRSTEMKSSCCFLLLSFTMGAHLFLVFIFRNTKRFEITC
jgi:hypothetical protein